jgi:hypothetical protein
MGSHEGGRWDVEIENNAVHVERISDADKQVFEDFLASEEARELAGLLTKFADQLDQAGDADDSEDSEDSEDSDEISDKSEDSDKPSD